MASLEARCREKLASFKIPRRFEAVEKLPRNALGKVQKHLLRSEVKISASSLKWRLMARILMVTSEASPFAKTGGLGDVLGSLPAALVAPRRRGCRGVAAISRRADRRRRPESGYQMPLWLGPHQFIVAIDEVRSAKASAISSSIARRSTIAPASTTNPAGITPTITSASALLNRAALEIARNIFRPDVFHAHDWPAGTARPVSARELRRRSDVFSARSACSPFTIWATREISRRRLWATWAWTASAVSSGRARVLRPGELLESGHRLVGRDHHGQPDLCPRNSDARVRISGFDGSASLASL